MSERSVTNVVFDPSMPLQGRIRRLSEALLAPPMGPERPQICGVFDSAGNPVAESQCYGGALDDNSTQFPAEPPDAADCLSGTWLYGGILSAHFGHMLCEGTARLWALDEIGPVDGIVFFGRPFDRASIALRRFGTLAKLLGLPAVKVITAPTIISELVLSEQGFGTEKLLSARPEMRKFLRDRLASSESGAGRARLFVTRSGQPLRRGMVFDEAGLEPLFAAAGYDVIRPEDLLLETHVDLFRSASHIVASEGSALHLVSFAAPSSCKVAAIRRRISPVYNQICDSLAWFIGAAPLELTELVAIHRPRRGRNPNLTYLEPSRVKLRERLIDAGFLPASTPDWPELTMEGRSEITAKIHAETGHRVELVSV